MAQIWLLRPMFKSAEDRMKERLLETAQAVMPSGSTVRDKSEEEAKGAVFMYFRRNDMQVRRDSVEARRLFISLCAQ